MHSYISIDDQCTPTHYASASGRVQCFQCLLEHGADISLKNNSGENPLDVARKHGKPHAISKAGKYSNCEIIEICICHALVC